VTHRGGASSSEKESLSGEIGDAARGDKHADGGKDQDDPFVLGAENQ
jgi:hypothetical protein